MQVYHELFASYTFGRDATRKERQHPTGWSDRLLADLTIQISVKNILNTLPPLDPVFSPYYASPYGDLRLRDYSISLRKAF
jgi:outer membrane receptor protein involved in Fe transport